MLSNKHTPAAHLHPRSNPTTAPHPPGVYRGAPLCQIGPTGQTGLTQAQRPRNTHTPVAIKLPCIPLRHIFARVIPNSGTANPRGITWRTHLVRQVRQVRLVRQVRHKRHAHATRIPPQPSRLTRLFCEKRSDCLLILFSRYQHKFQLYSPAHQRHWRDQLFQRGFFYPFQYQAEHVDSGSCWLNRPFPKARGWADRQNRTYTAV